jgi:hypothetical protein
MTARIATMTTRQKRIVRHSLDLFAILMVILGLWLASGIHTVTPKQTHTEYSTSINV